MADNDNTLLLGEIKGKVDMILEDVREHARKDELAHESIDTRLSVLEAAAAARQVEKNQMVRMAAMVSGFVSFAVGIGSFLAAHWPK